MKDYILDRVREIRISPERKKQKEQQITAEEFSRLRAFTGSVLWCVRKCRPDVAGPISLLQRKGKDARVRDLIEVNSIVQHVRDTADLGIHYRPIPIERVRICVFADASLNTVSGCKSQGATMLCLVDQDVLEGKEGVANLVLWRSGTIDRVCAGSLAAEANAMAAACHQAEWTQQAFCEMTNASYDDHCRKTILRDWESSSSESSARTVVRGALIVRNSTDDKLKQNIVVTDAKALYDALDRQCLRAKEKQVALVTAEIKQVMAVAGLVPRWIPHNVMVVDGLTKELKKSNLKPLLQFMGTGKLKLTAEEDEVDARRQLREEGGRVQRFEGSSRNAQESI